MKREPVIDFRPIKADDIKLSEFGRKAAEAVFGADALVVRVRNGYCVTGRSLEGAASERRR